MRPETRSNSYFMSSGLHDSNTSNFVNVFLVFAAVIAFAFSNGIMTEWAEDVYIGMVTGN